MGYIAGRLFRGVDQAILPPADTALREHEREVMGGADAASTPNFDGSSSTIEPPFRLRWEPGTNRGVDVNSNIEFADAFAMEDNEGIRDSAERQFSLTIRFTIVRPGMANSQARASRRAARREAPNRNSSSEQPGLDQLAERFSRSLGLGAVLDDEDEEDEDDDSDDDGNAPFQERAVVCPPLKRSNTFVQRMTRRVASPPGDGGGDATTEERASFIKRMTRRAASPPGDSNGDPTTEERSVSFLGSFSRPATLQRSNTVFSAAMHRVGRGAAPGTGDTAAAAAAASASKEPSFARSTTMQRSNTYFPTGMQRMGRRAGRSSPQSGMQRMGHRLGLGSGRHSLPPPIVV